jgi:hypothetical protein
MGNKNKFSAQESDLAPFVGNGTKVKIPSEIKLPLIKMELRFYLLSKSNYVENLFFLKNVAQ